MRRPLRSNRDVVELLRGLGLSQATQPPFAITKSAGAQAEAYGRGLDELRAEASLARLWGEQGQRAEARDLPASVYGWFTEDFDTADLKETAALLTELA